MGSQCRAKFGNGAVMPKENTIHFGTTGSVRFWILVLLICISGCTPSAEESAVAGTTTPLPTWTPLALLEIQPSWVRWTSPAISSSVSVDSYRGDGTKVCVEIDVSDLIQKGDHFDEPGVVSERIGISIDETELTNQTVGFWVKVSYKAFDADMNVVSSWSGPYSFCWSAELDTGIHQAELRFQQTSGAVRRYNWQFALTAESPPQAPTATPVGTPEPLPPIIPLPTPEPLPGFITELVPAPSTSLSLKDFDNKVCVGVDAETLLDGQHLDSQTFAQRFTVSLNGTPLSGLIEVTRKLVGGSEEKHCWIRVAIAPGTYRAVFRFERKATESVEYQWYFTIRED